MHVGGDLIIAICNFVEGNVTSVDCSDAYQPPTASPNDHKH